MSATRSEPRVPDTAAGVGPERDRSVSREKLALFLRNPTGMLGLTLVIMFFASAMFAHVFATHDPFAMDIPNRLSGPTAAHWAGTDQLGRDTFTRVLYGGRVALQVAAVGVSVSLVAGLILGMLAGFGPAWLDNLLLLVFDSIRSFPTVVLALAAVALLGPSLELVLAIVIVTSIPGYGRLVRTSTLALKNTEFILAERSLGAGTWRILAHHIMPNVIGPLLILAAMDVPVVVTIEGRPELPRSRRAAADRELGHHPQRRLSHHPRHAVDGRRRRHSAGADDARVHVPRRGPARRLRSKASQGALNVRHRQTGRDDSVVLPGARGVPCAVG